MSLACQYKDALSNEIDKHIEQGPDERSLACIVSYQSKLFGLKRALELFLEIEGDPFYDSTR